MDISIIIVNWNSVDYLVQCIQSIYKHTKDTSLEIIVIDNASTDNAVDTLLPQFPAIKLIKNDRNLGFAGANNRAFRQSCGEHVLFLNPDTCLVNAAIDTMLARLKCLPNPGIVGAKLLNTDLSVQTSSIQRYPTILNQLTDIELLRIRWPRCRLWAIAPLFLTTLEPVAVEVISGACMMLRREVFELVGMFSEDYFMYAEDIDLSYKVSQAGFTNYFVGTAVIVHHGGRSSVQRTTNQWATLMKCRAMTTFCRKTYGRTYSIVFRVAMGFAAAVRLLVLLSAAGFGAKGVSTLAVSKWNAVLRWATGLETDPKVST